MPQPRWGGSCESPEDVEWTPVLNAIEENDWILFLDLDSGQGFHASGDYLVFQTGTDSRRRVVRRNGFIILEAQ